MTVYFTGAAIGSALATVAWVHWKWNGVCVLALSLIALAGVRHATGNRDGASDHHHAAAEDALMEA
jgi:membrane protein implicated in regulation of membrane protease activity